MSGTVFTWAGNVRAKAVQAAAQLKGSNLKTADFIPGTAPEGFPEFASAPVFETDAGCKITQFGAIMAHINGGLSPCEAEALGWAENVITPAASTWVFPTLGSMPNNKGVIAQGKKDLLDALACLNEKLATKTFLSGDRAGVSDAAVFASLFLAFKQVLAPEYRKDIPHVTRWFNTCLHHGSFKAFGSLTLCEKEAQFDAKTFAAVNQKGKAAPAKKQEKKPAPKKEEAKPAPAAAEAPAKKGDPWAGLGGKYDMDAWKRCYSNNDTVPVAMDYFWKHLDKENYSCWFGKYLYGDEIAMPFMASNLIRGMFQRLDKMRKHSFGSSCVFGGEKAGDIGIECVFFWKGQGMAFELCDDWKVDYDTYEWTKLNFDDEADKKKITEYFAHEGEFGGKKFYEGKVFK